MKHEEALAKANKVKTQLAPYCERLEITRGISLREPEISKIEIVAILKPYVLIPEPYNIGLFDIGIQAPSVGILSDEFLLEVKNMKQKNVAFELLKKLLTDDIRIRKTKNISQAKKFSEMIEGVVKKYHNNQIDSAQVLEELSAIAREMKLEDNKAGELGLTEEEYAFYSVLSQNDSTKFLDDDKMKELIHHIVDIIRKNATVDWSKRSDVRAKLRLTVRKILIRYGYPPDLARLEADRVLEQSEALAEAFTKDY